MCLIQYTCTHIPLESIMYCQLDLIFAADDNSPETGVSLVAHLFARLSASFSVLLRFLGFAVAKPQSNIIKSLVVWYFTLRGYSLQYHNLRHFWY